MACLVIYVENSQILQSHNSILSRKQLHTVHTLSLCKIMVK